MPLRRLGMLIDSYLKVLQTSLIFEEMIRKNIYIHLSQDVNDVFVKRKKITARGLE